MIGDNRHIHTHTERLDRERDRLRLTQREQLLDKANRMFSETQGELVTVQQTEPPLHTESHTLGCTIIQYEEKSMTFYEFQPLNGNTASTMIVVRTD